jgi:hypothetical protein
MSRRRCSETGRVSLQLRSSASKNPDGSLKTFYLERAFKYQPSNRFEFDTINSAEANGVPLGQIIIGRHMPWRGSHSITRDAQKVNFVADEGYKPAG